MRGQAFNYKKAALARWLAMLAGVCILNASTAAQNNLPETINQKVNAVLQSVRGAGKSNTLGKAKLSTAPRFAQTEDGYLKFLGAPPDHDFPVISAVHGNPQSTARNFVKERSVAFGIRSSKVDFVTKKLRTRGNRHNVRFQQTYADLPVFGAEIIIQLNSADGVEYVLSDIMRNTESLDTGQVAIIPAVAPEEAQQIAVNMMAQNNPDLNYTTQEPNLMIYQPSVLGNAGKTRLVWQTTVATVPMSQAAEFVLVDAHDGEIALHYSLIKNAKYRQIYDAYNTSNDPGTLSRSEGDPQTGQIDCDNAYDYFGDSYDFYYNYHGRDSINGGGMTMNATVRFCPESPCPWYNAYWDPFSKRMCFGEGFVADDVIGHELTHGVTDYESWLIYYYESGAINESFSDMWGEWIDQTNGKGNDSTSVKWLLGEDTAIGAMRSMKDPPTYGDPDRMCSPFWYSGSGDNAGVHTNNGVGNKLCYLLTDGDVFNGYSLTGMGIEKTADLFYEVQTNLLICSADYYDLYCALTQAATNLDWSAAEKQNLKQACDAVEIGPPLAPGSISYPTDSATGQYTISWLASSRAEWYRLERSDDGGSTWLEIYAEASTSYAESVGNGSYIYRVRAIDINTGGSSDWTTGDWDCVVYLLTPAAPDSISYPTNSSTGRYAVSWAESSGATSYQLERSDDAGSTWSEVYSGSNTSYSESIGNGSYRYRVKATNTGGSSDWTTVDWDCVVYIIPYCSASSKSCDECIKSVIVGTINNTGTICSHYADYTAMSTIMETCQSYQITVTNGKTTYLSDQCGIWVDWNQDHSFDDPNETITVSGSPGVGPYTAVIAVPVDAVLGNTRMRIRITYTGGMSPCGIANYGEVEDYTVNIIEGYCPCTTQEGDGFESGNFSALPWVTSGNGNWSVTSARKNSGVYSAKAGTIAHNQSTSLEFTFEVETGNITFYRKVSSELDCDWLRFYIDGVQQAEWSGELGWAEFTYPIAVGTRNFKWTYSKDYSVASGSDTAWIDDITFPIAIPCIVGDFNHDGDVDTDDLGTFCEGWLTDDAATDIAPTDGDGIVDMMDFAVFAQNWLDGTSP